MGELTAGLVDALVKAGYRVMAYDDGFLVQAVTSEALVYNPAFFQLSQFGWPQSDGSWWGVDSGSGSGDEN